MKPKEEESSPHRSSSSSMSRSSLSSSDRLGCRPLLLLTEGVDPCLSTPFVEDPTLRSLFLILPLPNAPLKKESILS